MGQDNWSEERLDDTNVGLMELNQLAFIKTTSSDPLVFVDILSKEIDHFRELNSCMHNM